jgi:serine/threonine protein kinase/tetratricopeptide (TPR) repeat protein
LSALICDSAVLSAKSDGHILLERELAFPRDSLKSPPTEHACPSCFSIDNRCTLSFIEYKHIGFCGKGKMVGRTVSHYKILDKLGEGGMGEVYLAEDRKLNRRVALKFLPARLSSQEELKERFKREARAAAALNHPNIITIHEVSEYEGQPFIAMEYVEGESLKDLIAGKELSTSEVLDIALQVSEGLAVAHGAGIVHRDIKPQNILLGKDGRVKICDFGLAKLKTDITLTQAGSTLGTVAYMSPEQAQGKEVDDRSDIFSLGVVLYEMTAGRLPFRGDHEAAVIHSILNDAPEPLVRYKSDVPESLQRIVDKALEKNRDTRYQHADDLRADLKKLSTELESGVTKTIMPGEKPSPSVAVLPFVNLSGDPEQEYFCDGMAEEIINALTQVEPIRVVARTSAFSFRGKEVDVRDIGRKLNVQALLEGSVRKAGNRVRITAQLINVGDGYHLWSERFDRDLADVFAIQDEISLAIVDRLKVKLLGDRKEKMLRRYTQNLEAYDLYLKGRYHWNRRTPDALNKAMAHFEQVVRKDPDYALVYAGLADCYSMLAQVRVFTPKEAFPKAKALAKKALEIDETLAEAHTALAFALFCFDWDWAGAEREFRRAIELNPNYATARQWFAMALAKLRRTREAIQEILKALELDPLSLIINTSAGFVYFYSGREDKAVEQAEKILDMDPTFLGAHTILALVNKRRGKRKEGLEGILKASLFVGFLSQPEVAALLETYASSGWTDCLRRWVEIMQSKAEQGQVMYYYMASLYASLDDTEKAIECLERAYEEHDYNLDGLLVDDDFEKLRSDPRFIAIIKKMEFPE